MVPQLTIAIDYDDTYTADPDCWRRVIDVFRSHGHQVICVSARRDLIGHRQEIESALPDGVKVLLSYDAPKRMFANAHGYAVDIWIDDMPEAIPSKKDILANCG